MRSVLRITDWHHEACRVMTKAEPKGQIFLSPPHRNDRLFFLAHCSTPNFISEKTLKRLLKILYTLRCGIHVTRQRNFNITMTSQISVRPVCVLCAAVHFLSFLRVGMGYVRLFKTAEILIWFARRYGQQT